MSPLELLNAYLERIEARFRLAALARGAALVGAAGLAATLVLVLTTNWYAFSARSLTGGRIALFLCLSLVVGFGLVLPLLRLNRRRAARAAEEKAPGFEQRLLTLAERQASGEGRPFLELLAADTLDLARDVEPRRVVSGRMLAGLFSTAAVALGLLLWLILGASGFLGYGAHLLWAGARSGETQAFYDIVIHPGNRTVRRHASQAVTARLVGFQTPTVRLYAKYRDASKWEEAPMLPQRGALAYEFLFAGIPETVDYYVVAGKLRSKTFTLGVVDLPGVKRLRVTYHYPAWTNRAQEVEDPGGDLRAVEGTEAEVAVETDRPLASGQLVMDDGSRIALDGRAGNWRTATVKIQKDGAYHIAALEQGEQVRLTDDYFIEVLKDSEPMVRILRPGRDARVSPIEEVPVAVEAADDFGLQDVTLHYSVNGGAEKTVPMLKQKSAKQTGGSTVFYLEDYKLVPGDLVSLYATARDARSSSRTDMFFIETQPFEREYTQSQQMGGGEMGGQGERQGQISQRQKEIISATWNQLRDTSRDKQAAAENARFLSEMQAKLRDQARSLSTRMNRRELSGQSQEFQTFSGDMAQAAQYMGTAAERLKSMKWQEALAPEQQALQHLLRAESTYRQIQVAFGNRGGRGGGGGGGAQRDLENLFDLELDTEKNQYETGQQASTGGSQRSREIDEALQRLEQLARRQQELANQLRQPQRSFQQRWQQEMLRREAEQLQQRMQQLARGGGSQGGAQGQADSRLDQALSRLSQATDDMRRASSSQNNSSQQAQAESRRAADRLREAQDLMRGMRGDQASQQLDDLTRRADRLASEQQDFQERLRQAFGKPEEGLRSPDTARAQMEKSQQLAGERDKMLEDLNSVEEQMERAAREIAGSQHAASSRLRSALGDLQQDEIATRMRYNSEMLRRGYGPLILPRETPITQGLNRLRDRLREAQGALDRNAPGRSRQEQALAGLERVRNRLQGLTQQGAGQSGEQGQRDQGQGQRGGAQRGDMQGGGRNGYAGQYGGTRGLSGGPQGWMGGFDRGAPNRGDWQPAPLASEFRSGSESDAARLYQESLRDLAALRGALQGAPEAARDIQDVLAELKRLAPSKFPGNPELLERIRTQILPQLEQAELQLRRQVDEEQGGQVRNAGSETVPPGYSSAVADYFRRLSKGK